MQVEFHFGVAFNLELAFLANALNAIDGAQIIDQLLHGLRVGGVAVELGDISVHVGFKAAEADLKIGGDIRGERIIQLVGAGARDKPLPRRLFAAEASLDGRITIDRLSKKHGGLLAHSRSHGVALGFQLDLLCQQHAHEQQKKKRCGGAIFEQLGAQITGFSAIRKFLAAQVDRTVFVAPVDLLQSRRRRERELELVGRFIDGARKTGEFVGRQMRDRHAELLLQILRKPRQQTGSAANIDPIDTHLGAIMQRLKGPADIANQRARGLAKALTQGQVRLGARVAGSVGTAEDRRAGFFEVLGLLKGRLKARGDRLGKLLAAKLDRAGNHQVEVIEDEYAGITVPDIDDGIGAVGGRGTALKRVGHQQLRHAQQRRVNPVRLEIAEELANLLAPGKAYQGFGSGFFDAQFGRRFAGFRLLFGEYLEVVDNPVGGNRQAIIEHMRQDIFDLGALLKRELLANRHGLVVGQKGHDQRVIVDRAALNQPLQRSAPRLGVRLSVGPVIGLLRRAGFGDALFQNAGLARLTRVGRAGDRVAVAHRGGRVVEILLLGARRARRRGSDARDRLDIVAKYPRISPHRQAYKLERMAAKIQADDCCRHYLSLQYKTRPFGMVSRISRSASLVSLTCSASLISSVSRFSSGKRRIDLPKSTTVSMSVRLEP